MLYTIGHQENYLKAAKQCRKHGELNYKIGKRDDWKGQPYPGGYIFKTIEDAKRRIVEEDRIGEWDVFGVKANWDTDTYPDPDGGWWNLLLKDAPIIILEWRKDGWPLCPMCEEDEVWSPLIWDGTGSRPPIEQYIDAGLSCYQCGWKDN